MLKIRIPWVFIRSTTIVLGISALLAISAKSIGLNFWAIFGVGFSIQYILFSFLATIIKNYQIQKTFQKELDRLEPLSTILNCAYCAKPNIMTFLPDQNERVEFSCNSCNKTNLVTIQFMVARITEPVNIPNLTGIPSIQSTSVNEI